MFICNWAKSGWCAMQMLGIKETPSIIKMLMLMNAARPSATAKICIETMIKDLNFVFFSLTTNGNWRDGVRRVEWNGEARVNLSSKCTLHRLNSSIRGGNGNGKSKKFGLIYARGTNIAWFLVHNLFHSDGPFFASLLHPKCH